MNSKTLPIVAIVGRPNVGKSTLFNRLLGRRLAVTAKEAGTTRDLVTGEISWNDKNFLLVDTAGLIFDFFGFKEEEIERKAQDKLQEIISVSDLVLFVVDARAGVTAEDKEISRLIRKSGKEIVVVLNKADSPRLEEELSNVQEFGFNDQIAVSSITGRRSGNLLDLIAKKVPKVKHEVGKFPKISIIGRPNAGKSSVFNLLSKRQIAIVSQIQGTTRDTISNQIKIARKDYEIIDTAGFRRRGKIAVGIEKFSILRAIQSIFLSDIVLLIVDAKEGFTRTDAHLADLALKNNKKLLVVVNKIDLLKSASTQEIRDFERYGFILKNTIIGVSAKTGQNFDLLEQAISSES